MKKKILSFLVSLRQKISNKEFKKLLPQIYLSGLIFSFVLTLLFTIYPSLTICSGLFGDDFCTPAGLFFGVLLSLPGYLIVGNILPLLPVVPIVVSLILVLVFSGAVYYFIGLFIDKLKKVKRVKRGRTVKSSKITVFIVAFFVFILIIFLILLAQTR
ncbi:hypothetical protein IID22_05435 [Patescibacteria group bacterium]|nr:hypothetical protein [Patescibacteria group bacterium]